MADFNQSPPSQQTQDIPIPQVDVQAGALSVEWFRGVRNYQLFSDGQLQDMAVVTISGGGGVVLPTTGQIWPSGIYA